MLKKQYKKIFLSALSLGSISLAAGITLSSCSLISNLLKKPKPNNPLNPNDPAQLAVPPGQDPTTPTQPPQEDPDLQFIKNKSVNLVPENTAYKIIHDLSFSLKFNNTGGFQHDNGSSGTDNKPIKPHDKPYSVSGTGWLFDWKLNSDQPDKEGNINWTGYFATNLHVADGLLNPSDGGYTPSWLKNRILTNYDLTDTFDLGKYDNSNDSLSSVNKTQNITYVNIGDYSFSKNTLPKTQFASANFTNSLLSKKDPETGSITEYQTYVDFAILAINVRYYSIPLNVSQRMQNNVWNYWIRPAMQTLQNTYPENLANKDFTYQELFDPTSYLIESKPNFGNVYIGGYPFYSADEISNLSQKKLAFNSRPSPIWTINSSGLSNKFIGQPIDTNNISTITGRQLPNGIYNANYFSNFITKYHGQSYKNYGIGYAVLNSRMRSGASGSMSLNSKNKLLGIYYGGLKTSDSDQAAVGLVSSLIVNEVPKNLDEEYKFDPYDLIGWSSTNKLITNQNKSYFSSLKSPTYLFSNVAAAESRNSSLDGWIRG